MRCLGSEDAEFCYLINGEFLLLLAPSAPGEGELEHRQVALAARTVDTADTV